MSPDEITPTSKITAEELFEVCPSHLIETVILEMIESPKKERMEIGIALMCLLGIQGVRFDSWTKAVSLQS